jgi:hypothetical protein
MNRDKIPLSTAFPKVYFVLMVKQTKCIPEQVIINNAMIHFHIISPDAAIEKCHCLHVNSCLDESQNHSFCFKQHV